MKNTFNLFALRLALVVALLCASSGAMGASYSGPTPIDAPQNEHSIVVISDICGNKYNVVKIGKQIWMAENMRCNKYDTESERAGATVPLPRVTNAYYPYYQVYPSSGTNQTGFNGKLLNSQIPYLGIFFSWAAAVGFANDTEALSQTTPFKNHRQGICPNGWHLPTIDEWHELVDFIELTDGKGKYTAGKHLKTKQGWHNNKNGLDTYGFSALPADRADMSGTYGVGGWGKWWTSDAISKYNGSAVQVYHGGDDFMFSANEVKAKSYALCVRCIKNPEKLEIKFVNYDGTELQSGEVEYGQTPSYTGATPEKPADAEFTYTFSGWSPEVVMVTETATYTAQFSNTVNKYVIRFLDENGDVLQSSEVAYGLTPAYTGETPTKQATAQYTYTFNGWDSEITKVTGAKDYTATYTAILVHETADNTPECANAPAVAKYDWLLMLQANAIKDMGYNLNENIVEWYRVVGEMDNLDSEERDDEKVGTGYYYTINSNLNSTGDYYALIDLPWQTSEVGCNGLMRTVVFHYTPKGSTKRAMAVSPTIAFPQQEIEVRDLPQEVAEVYVYDVAGRLCRSFRTNGEATTMFNAEQNAGTYIVVVWTSKGKETFKYIVRMR